MSYVHAPPMTLMQLWRLHRGECRAIGSIVADARAGTLPGIEPLESGFGFAVTNQRAALGAMTKAVTRPSTAINDTLTVKKSRLGWTLIKETE